MFSNVSSVIYESKQYTQTYTSQRIIVKPVNKSDDAPHSWPFLNDTDRMT